MEAIASTQQMTDRERGKHGKKERGAMEAEGLKSCIKYSRKDPKLQDFQRSICWYSVAAEVCSSTTAARAGAAACYYLCFARIAPKFAPVLLGAK